MIAELDDIVERADDIKALRQAGGREMSKARVEQMAALKRRLDKLLAERPALADDEVKASAELERLAAAFYTAGARRKWAPE